MRKFINFSVKLFLSMFLSVIVLNIMTFVYRYTGVHISNHDHSTDYTWEPNQYQMNMKEGFSWIKMDDNGFNNYYPSKKNNPDYLLMGSSHMEAVQMDSEENAGYILNLLLPNEYFYNIGISGHTIYRCVNNLKNANKEFRPSKGIIIEISQTDLDDKMLSSVIDGKLKPIKSYDTGLIYFVQKYAQSIKFLFNQIADWRKMDSKVFGSNKRSNSHAVIHYKQYSEKLNDFLALAKSSIQTDKKLLFVYKPTTKIDENGKYISTKKDPSTELFKEACLRNEIDFIDLSDAFENLYNSKHILAHGFINSAVGVGHLNKYGHRVFAEEVAKVIGGNN